MDLDYFGELKDLATVTWHSTHKDSLKQHFSCRNAFFWKSPFFFQAKVEALAVSYCSSLHITLSEHYYSIWILYYYSIWMWICLPLSLLLVCYTNVAAVWRQCHLKLSQSYLGKQATLRCLFHAEAEEGAQAAPSRRDDKSWRKMPTALPAAHGLQYRIPLPSQSCGFIFMGHSLRLAVLGYALGQDCLSLCNQLETPPLPPPQK